MACLHKLNNNSMCLHIVAVKNYKIALLFAVATVTLMVSCSFMLQVVYHICFFCSCIRIVSEDRGVRPIYQLLLLLSIYRLHFRLSIFFAFLFFCLT